VHRRACVGREFENGVRLVGVGPGMDPVRTTVVIVSSKNI
jgi:hypothetical protein